jgi:hypothetical protein
MSSMDAWVPAMGINMRVDFKSRTKNPGLHGAAGGSIGRRGGERRLGDSGREQVGEKREA